MKKILLILIVLASVGSGFASYLPTVGKRIGEVLSLPYNGRKFTATDGTVWLSQGGVAEAYVSAYSGLITDAPQALSSGVLLPAPNGTNFWEVGPQGNIIAGGSGGGSVWVMVPSTTTLGIYWTSTDAGQTWTQRTNPAGAGSAWNVHWNGTQFILYTGSSTTSYTSTDGVNWTSRTCISLSPADIIYANSLYVVYPNGGSSAATSSDGITWTSRTLASSAAGTTATIGGGLFTYNAGAGLWIGNSGTNGAYQTSPDAITWTARTLPVTQAFKFSAPIRLASNSTTTVAISAQWQEVLTTTDGINWTARGVVDSNVTNGTGVPSTLFWDGSRFVTVIKGITYYSSNGTSWTRAVRANFPNSVTYIVMPAGLAGFNASTGSIFYVSDVTSVTNNSVVPLSGGLDGVLTSYMRIK